MFVILLAEAMAATVVPYLMAITVKFSPDFTVWVRVDVEPSLSSDGIAIPTGTVNCSPVLSSCGFALTSSRTVTPYLLAMDSKVSPAATVCFLGVGCGSVCTPANLYRSSRVPLKTFKSTRALMPLMRPLSLYCQNVHLNQPRGSEGRIPGIY